MKAPRFLHVCRTCGVTWHTWSDSHVPCLSCGNGSGVERFEIGVGSAGRTSAWTSVMLVSLASLVVWRLYVPAALDVSATSIHKDVAHLIVGAALGCGLRRPRSWEVVAAAVAVSLFELFYFLATRGAS